MNVKLPSGITVLTHAGIRSKIIQSGLPSRSAHLQPELELLLGLKDIGLQSGELRSNPPLEPTAGIVLNEAFRFGGSAA